MTAAMIGCADEGERRGGVIVGDSRSSSA